MIAELLKLSGLMLGCSVKFLYFVPAAYIAGYSFWQTILIAVTGGWLGILSFYYAGQFIVSLYDQYVGRFLRTNRQRKKFTRSARILVKVKNKYGLIGLALISPTIISIPVGCIIAAKYFSNDRKTVPVFFSSIVFWAFVLTGLTSLFNFHF